MRFYDYHDKEVSLSEFFRFAEYDGAADREGTIETLERRIENLSITLENVIAFMISKDIVTLEDLEILQKGTHGYKSIHTISEDE